MHVQHLHVQAPAAIAPPPFATSSWLTSFKGTTDNFRPWSIVWDRSTMVRSARVIVIMIIDNLAFRLPRFIAQRMVLVKASIAVG